MAVDVDSVLQKYGTVTPHLVVRDAAAAIAFYVQAFGAEETYRMLTPDGSLIVHAELKIGDSYVFLCDVFPNMGDMSPDQLQGSPVTLHLMVNDVDALFAQATAAGATVTMPLENMFWGDRYGKLVDPFGHHWAIATPVESPSPDEVKQRMALAFGG
jgi:PhnB protein